MGLEDWLRITARRVNVRRKRLGMPDFLGIGATRAGTTWVARRLAAHPDISMHRKEIHFFDRKLGRTGFARNRVDRLRYAVRFLNLRGWPPRPGRLRGEFTPAYAVLPPATVARIAAWMPAVKLIFMLRDPFERAWSQARFGFPRWRGKPVTDAGRGELRSFLDSERVRSRSDYAACVRTWMRYFDGDQFFFGLYDDIRDRPAGLLRDLHVFLGVTPVMPSPQDLSEVANASSPAPMPEWVRAHLRKTYRFDYGWLEELSGRTLPWGEPSGEVAAPPDPAEAPAAQPTGTRGSTSRE